MYKLILYWIRYFTGIVSTRLNTELCYYYKFHRRINLVSPMTFNEKILWLKLNEFSKSSLYSLCADKYRVREYIENKGCPEILNDLIAVYKNPDEIEWNSLPNKFALKYNNGCGCNIICSDKEKMNFETIKKECRKWISRNHYAPYSEIQYKNIPGRIIVEKYLGKEGIVPEDYKFYCMNGKAKYVGVCIGRGSKNGMKFCMYDRNWNWVKLGQSCPEDPKLAKPEKIDLAFQYADKLSSDFKFVRLDFYIVDKKIIFGEYTFTPCGGLDNHMYEDADVLLGSEIVL